MNDQFYEEGKRAFYTCAQWETPYLYGSYAAASWAARYQPEVAKHHG